MTNATSRLSQSRHVCLAKCVFFFCSCVSVSIGLNLLALPDIEIQFIPELFYFLNFTFFGRPGSVNSVAFDKRPLGHLMKNQNIRGNDDGVEDRLRCPVIKR